MNSMNSMHCLHTERLVLRHWREQDKEAFAALNADARVMEHFPAPLTRQQSDALAERIMAFMAANGWGLWAVSGRGSDEFMGFVGVQSCPANMPFAPALEVGWRLATPFWGQGYATEAARASLHFVATVLHEKSVVAFTALSNVRSQALMRRLGMEEEGTFEDPRLPQGHRLQRHVLYRSRFGQTD